MSQASLKLLRCGGDFSPETMRPPERPAVLNGIVVLTVILGVFQILFGVIFLLTNFPFPVCTGMYFFLGALTFVVIAGLHRLQRWAWTAAVILLIVDFVFTFPIGTFPTALLLVYILKPEVKAAFGHGPPVPPAFFGMAPPYVPDPWARPPPPPPGPPAVPPVGSANCPACGAPLAPEAKFCIRCGTPVR